MAKADYKLTSLLTSQAVKSNSKLTTFLVEEGVTPEIYSAILADDYIIPVSCLLVLKAEDGSYQARLGDGINTWSDSAPFISGGSGEDAPATMEDLNQWTVDRAVTINSKTKGQGWYLLAKGELPFEKNGSDLVVLFGLTHAKGLVNDNEQIKNGILKISGRRLPDGSLGSLKAIWVLNSGHVPENFFVYIYSNKIVHLYCNLESNYKAMSINTLHVPLNEIGDMSSCPELKVTNEANADTYVPLTNEEVLALTDVRYSNLSTIRIRNASLDSEAVNLSQLNSKVPTGGTASTFLAGDSTWKTPVNTTYTTMTQAEATAGTVATGRTISALVLSTTIDNKLSALVPAPPNEGTAVLTSVNGVISWVVQP